MANAVEMTKEELRALLAFASKDKIRPNFCAVSFARREDDLYLVATDDCALAMFPASGSAPCSRTYLPREVLDDALKLAKKNSRIRISESGGRWTVSVDDGSIPCPDKDTTGAYPDVWAIACPAPCEDAPVPSVDFNPEILARLAACAKAAGGKKPTPAIMLAPGDARRAVEFHVGRFKIAIMPMRPSETPVRHFTGRDHA